MKYNLLSFSIIFDIPSSVRIVFHKVQIKNKNIRYNDKHLLEKRSTVNFRKLHICQILLGQWTMLNALM
jgi:hypothetical protein